MTTHLAPQKTQLPRAMVFVPVRRLQPAAAALARSAGARGCVGLLPALALCLSAKV